MHTTFSDAVNQGKLPQFNLNEKINDPALYQPSEGLWNAVTVALELGLPLLLTGEPGTGKTQLAHYIAWYFQVGEYDEKLERHKPLVFQAQTSSAARDLFYRYDALSHFQFSQNKKEELTPAQVEDRFIEFEALGKAIKEKKQYVVLMDEIDKAPRDLPNNILAALEDLFFKVAETGSRYEAEAATRPIIIMTSNSEKNLPDPFLRRVAFYHISAEEIDLLKILQSKVEGLSAADYDGLISHYQKIRKGRKGKLQKNPATAELIHWAGLLVKMGFPTQKLKDVDSLTADESAKLATSYSVLAKTKEDLDKLKKDFVG